MNTIVNSNQDILSVTNQRYIHGLRLESNESDLLTGLTYSNSTDNPDINVEFVFHKEYPDLSFLELPHNSFPIKAPVNSLKRSELLMFDNSYKLIYIYETLAIIFGFDKRGTRVTINSYCKPIRDTVINLFYHPIMGYLARLHGRICLHANIMLVNNKAVAFMGYSGAGKSTISTFLWNKGVEVISDDLGALTFDSGVYNVFRGQPRLRVHLNTALSICGSDIKYEKVFLDEPSDNNPKVYLGDAPETVSEKSSFPLEIIYILLPRRKDILKPIIKTLSPSEALIYMSPNTSAKEILGKKDRINEFKFLSGLAKSITIKSIECPDSLELLDDTGNFILQDIYSI